MFDWNDLRHFLAVAQHGSTIAAAKALGVNQSTVHRRLDELEARLGRRLVVRQASILNLRGGSPSELFYRREVAEATRRGVDFYDLPMSASRRPFAALSGGLLPRARALLAR